MKNENIQQNSTTWSQQKLCREKKTFKAIISIFRNLSEHLSERKSVATIEHKQNVITKEILENKKELLNIKKWYHRNKKSQQ